MKKFPAVLFYAMTCIVIPVSCRYHHNGDINFTVSESNHYYSMNADFSRTKTRAVEEYMDRRIGRKSKMSFVNSRIDGTLALDDHTTFYIKKYPGYLEIKLDKDKNSGEAYRQIKSMCGGIKKVITN